MSNSNPAVEFQDDPFELLAEEIEARPGRIPEWRHPEWEPLWFLDAANENAALRIGVTFFPDQSAQRMIVRELTLAGLRELIQHTTAAEKSRLPWIKLAAFGTKRTEKNCLRHNANVLTISGVEADYDGGRMTLDEAVAVARTAGLAALLYTSASYSDAAPRWRILLPCSRPLPPGEREKLVARVNGLFGGVLAPESFTLSQAYYFGAVGNNPLHRAVVTAGDCVDTRDDLDAGAMGKRNAIGKSNASEAPTGNDDRQASPDLVAAALDVIPNDTTPGTEAFWDTIGCTPDDRAYWVKVCHATKAAAGEEGAEAFDTWSQKWPGYDADDTAKLWASAQPTEIGAGTLLWLANAARPGWRDAYTAQTMAGLADAPAVQAVSAKTRLMQTSAEFVAGFVPPDYLIDGLLQRRYVYSFTSPTGGGKTTIALLIAAHVAHGMPLAEREVEQGRVLFFAGENPDDVRTRWIKLCEELGKDPDTMDVVFMPFTLNLSEKQIRERIDAEAAAHGPFSLLIVDTSAAYYSGDDENDNVALGGHARMLRTFVELPGGPTILVTCHPVKSPNMDNLLPRGGGAFLAEVDGNLVCIKDAATMVVEVTTHGKFRGPDFAPFSFELVAGKSEKLVDSKGRKIWSIFARAISNEDREAIEKAGHSDQDRLLRAMLDQPGRSLTELAEHLLWRTMDGRSNKQKVHRGMKDLHKAKLVERRRDGHYVLTRKGEDEAAATPTPEEPTPKPRMSARELLGKKSSRPG